MIRPAEGYARALIGAAEQSGCLQQVYEELGPISKTLEENAVFFHNPVIAAQRQVSVLRGTLEGKASALTVGFLTLLARRRRLKTLPDIVRRFESMAAESLGYVTVTLRIPFAPDEALLQKLGKRLATRGLIPRANVQDIRFNVILDKSLIGGFTAEHGGKILDASLRYKLRALRSTAR